MSTLLPPSGPDASDAPGSSGSAVGLLERPDEVLPVDDNPAAPPRRRGRVARFVRGRESDAAWVRPALLALLGLTAVLYLWDLGASGWANSFYSAAVQAGTKSWKAFFFGSSDSSNFITVDKPPGSLWIMEIAARVFGVNAWSILVPQALEGVAAVGLVYLTVRRWFSAQAALLAGAVLALTPVAALMFRFNNPDALLALLLTGSMYCLVRSLERAKTVWLVAAGALIGFGFLTKMLQAFLIIPALVIVYLFAAPTGWWRRVRQVVVMGLATVVAAGWWVAAMALTPAADRPYVGGSQNNSILNLIFGYNGFGRLTGNESGSVVGGGGPGGAGQWGPTGFTRLFNSSFGDMMSWLLPAALFMGAVLLVFTLRARRTDRERAALLLWGGTLVGMGLVISLSQGIIHPYYTVALAPPLAGLVGISAVGLWQRRSRLTARVALAAALIMTVVWTDVLLRRTPTWFGWLRGTVLVLGLLGAVAILGFPWLKNRPRLAVGLVSGLGLSAALAVPLFSTVATANTPHNGAIPSVNPTPAGGIGGPFGGGFPGGGFGGGRFAGGAPVPGGTGQGGFAGRPAFGGGGFPGGTGGTSGGTGGFAGGPPAGFRGGAPRFGGGTGTGGGFGGGFGGGGFGGAGGPGGGFLNASTPSAATTTLLQTDASKFTWAAATVNSNSAAGYQLASGEPVMAIGGFNGTDPAPTLAQFKQYVAEGKIHYFIASGGFGGGGFGGARSDDASQITSWVEAHFTAKTVGGTTLYDLTAAQR